MAGLRVIDGSRRGLADGPRGPHDGDMEARVARLEEDMREVKNLLNDKVMPLLVRIDERLAHTATKTEMTEGFTHLGERLNHAATKADLAEKPGKAYLWTVLAVLVAAILAAVSAGVAIGPVIWQNMPKP